MPGPRILCIGEDPSLLYVRQLVLEQAGYSVVTISAQQILASRDELIRDELNVELLLICHSVEQPVRATLISSLQRDFSHTPILLLDGGDHCDKIGKNLSRCPTRPADFLQSVRDLIAKNSGETSSS